VSSFRNGRPTGLTSSRVVGSTHLGSRAAVARFAGRHANTVARYCVPVACDIGTRAYLYDLDQCVDQLRATGRTALSA
jgi:hypothetical protein